MALVISTILNGQVTGPVTSGTTQEHTVLLSKGKRITKRITHTDRPEALCVQNTFISDQVLKEWSSFNCPFWEKIGQWKRMESKRRIDSYAKRFDEGFGVTLKFV